MATIISILRAILRALGLLRPTESELSQIADASLVPKVPASQSTQPPIPYYPYRRRDDFLSPAERNFFRVLYQVVGANTLICTKVNLADLFYVPSRDANEHRVYTNKIDRKHVDFVLCDLESLTPRLGIELDDRSHERADRQERDHFVANVFAEAGLPLLRVKVQRSYTVQELSEILHSYLTAQPIVPTDSSVTPSADTTANLRVSQMPPTETHRESASPTCPQCGNTMVLRTVRTVRNGANSGQKFWGCANYPRCRAMVSYTEPVTT